MAIILSIIKGGRPFNDVKFLIRFIRMRYQYASSYVRVDLVDGRE